MSRQTLTKLASIAITVILVAVLLSQIEVGNVAKTLINANPIYIIVAFIFYIVTYFFRALRFHTLLNRDIRITNVFTITCVHNMINNILPARTGELSYIYLLKKFHNKNFGESAATLIMARFFDFGSMAGLFLIAMLLIGNNLPNIMVLAAYSFAFLMILIALSMKIFYSGDTFIQLKKKLEANPKLTGNNYINFILVRLDETVSAFNRINRKKIINACLLSIGIWISLYSVNYAIVNALGMSLSFWTILLASTFAFLSSLLPIQGVGNFGTLEGAWTVGFMALGVSKEVAINSGFSYHILTYTFILILGLYGMLMLRFQG